MLTNRVHPTAFDSSKTVKARSDVCDATVKILGLWSLYKCEKCYKFNTLSDILTVYYKLKYILRLNWEDKILKMGGENSKIDTVKIPVSEIRANSPT